MPPKDLVKTRYVELIKEEKITKDLTKEPAFDEHITTEGYSEIRLWVHIHVDNSAEPIFGNAVINVDFMHEFIKTTPPPPPFKYSFVYTSGVITNKEEDDIYGCLAMPIIGDNLRIIGRPVGLPSPADLTLNVTYYLVS